MNTSKFSEENSGASESMICPCLGVEANLYQQGPVQFSSGLLYMGKFRGIASVRYAIGLTNVVKDDRAPSAKTRDLLLSFGVGFPIL